MVAMPLPCSACLHYKDIILHDGHRKDVLRQGGRSQHMLLTWWRAEF